MISFVPFIFIYLDDERKEQLWIPEGFSHGFMPFRTLLYPINKQLFILTSMNNLLGGMTPYYRLIGLFSNSLIYLQKFKQLNF